ncbi:MAG TPA: class E sortase [Sphingobacteriaceae bacterium]|nr:class E sortase [Sphingobacteriaceae bacterium]
MGMSHTISHEGAPDHAAPAQVEAVRRRPRRRTRWLRRLSMLMIIAGIILISIPPLQWGWAAYMQWRLEKQFEAGGAWAGSSSPLIDLSQLWPGLTPAETQDVGEVESSLTEQLLGYFWEDPSLTIPEELQGWAELNQPDPAIMKDFPGAMIRIPKIKVRAIVLYGTSLRTLAQGPGFYEVGALPGNPGNVAIAGHRTTYGAWFRHVDQLEQGDLIELTFQGAEYRYAVERVWVIAANDWSVVAPTEKPVLTLTACHPPGSAAYRIAVRANLIQTIDYDGRPPTADMPA